MAHRWDLGAPRAESQLVRQHAVAQRPQPLKVATAEAQHLRRREVENLYLDALEIGLLKRRLALDLG